MGGDSRVARLQQKRNEDLGWGYERTRMGRAAGRFWLESLRIWVLAIPTCIHLV
jgi:hypothetical protein